MISVEAAEQLIKPHLAAWGLEHVSSQDLSGAVSAEPIVADRGYPPDHRVMMDGIALSWQTYQQGVRNFPILGTVAAGEPKTTLETVEACLEVMTGAILPHQADLVIPYEHLAIEQGYAQVIVEQARQPFENVHRQGSDCQAGTLILEAHTPLNGPRWGIATSFGLSQIQCQKFPKVKVISTGNELVEIEQTPLPHQLRRSNAYALKASLLLHGYRWVDLDHLADDRMAIAAHYQKNCLDYDLLIYSGGVSKGKFDYLPDLWRELGVTQCFHGVSQKPGKPLWFGHDRDHHTVVVGLPGNPISSLVCLHRYILDTPIRYARLVDDVTFTPALTYFLPVKLDYSPEAIVWAHPLPMKNSGEFTALAHSDGFLELPLASSQFKAGDSFRFYPWRSP